jgi:hypothetical protein
MDRVAEPARGDGDTILAARRPLSPDLQGRFDGGEHLAVIFGMRLVSM